MDATLYPTGAANRQTDLRTPQGDRWHPFDRAAVATLQDSHADDPFRLRSGTAPRVTLIDAPDAGPGPSPAAPARERTTP